MHFKEIKQTHCYYTEIYTLQNIRFFGTSIPTNTSSQKRKTLGLSKPNKRLKVALPGKLKN